MDDKKYKLRFLPMFEQDLEEVAEYISERLQNPAAAIRFVDEIQAAINERLNYPKAFEPYPTR